MFNSWIFVPTSFFPLPFHRIVHYRGFLLRRYNCGSVRMFPAKNSKSPQPKLVEMIRMWIISHYQKSGGSVGLRVSSFSSSVMLSRIQIIFQSWQRGSVSVPDITPTWDDVQREKRDQLIPGFSLKRGNISHKPLLICQKWSRAQSRSHHWWGGQNRQHWLRTNYSRCKRMSVWAEWVLESLSQIWSLFPLCSQRNRHSGGISFLLVLLRWLLLSGFFYHDHMLPCDRRSRRSHFWS